MYFIYLMSDNSRQNIHAGYCQNVGRMLAFYDVLNNTSLILDPNKKLNRLVYLEQVDTEAQAKERIAHFTFMPVKQREAEILTVNPEWLDLTTCENFTFSQYDGKKMEVEIIQLLNA